MESSCSPPPPDITAGRLRARVLGVMVAASTLIGLLAAMDPSTLRPGLWSVLFFGALSGGGVSAVALLVVRRPWPDALLVVLLSSLMGLVVLSVLANQSRSGGMLNVVLLLPCSVYSAVYLSRRACRVVTVVLVVCLVVTMAAVTDVVIQWLTLVALPLVAFVGATEVVLRLRQELGVALLTLRRQSLTDPLNGLLNRRALEGWMAGAPGSSTVTVLVLDIDHFKTVNDTFGHAVGDDVLRRFGAGLAEETRADATVVRMGGEEFLVLSSTPAGRAEDFAQTLRTRAASWMSEWSATVSVGVVTVTRPGREGLCGDGLRAAIQTADECLYAAKSQGRNRVVVEVWGDSRPPASHASKAAGPLPPG